MLKGSEAIAWVLPSQGEQIIKRDGELLLRIATEIFADEFGIEAVKSGGDRGMGGEEISRPGDVQGQIKGFLMIFHIAARPFENGKRRMAFVEMANLGLQPKARNRRQPPMPRTISCFSRISASPP